MRVFTAIACLLLGACTAATDTKTTVSEGGKPVMTTGANAASFHFRSPGGSQLDVTGMDHGTPTLANGAATSLIIDATGRVIGIIANGVTTWLVAGGNPVPAVVASAALPTVNHVVNPPATMQIQQQWISPATGTRVTVRHKAKHRHRHRANDAPPKD